jgi:hypothetical protein
MSRSNGSYIGIDANPNANEASGLWTVREAERLLRADKWPATPTVPGAPTPVAGDEEVSLTWTAPTGGSAPTDYVVQYSSDGGANWTTFSDGVSTDTSATVAGLTNGTAYIFRIQAINVLGEGPFGSASGSVTPVAPSAATLLLSMDGSDGSTTFTDDSPTNASFTAYGNAQISTAESKFGGASGLFDGDGDYILSDDVPFDYDGDFTIDFWIRRTGPGVGGARTIFNGGNISGSIFGVPHVQLTPDFALAWDNAAAAGITGGDAPLDTWVHVACVRSDGTNTLYVDGVSVGTSAQSFPLVTSTVVIGGAPNYGFYFEGHIDEFRMVEGEALWDSNFTPPSSPY